MNDTGTGHFLRLSLQKWQFATGCRGAKCRGLFFPWRRLELASVRPRRRFYRRNTQNHVLRHLRGLRKNLANAALTLSAVGSGDTEQPVVGWRRWRWRTKDRYFRPPKSAAVSSG